MLGDSRLESTNRRSSLRGGGMQASPATVLVGRRCPTPRNVLSTQPGLDKMNVLLCPRVDRPIIDISTVDPWMARFVSPVLPSTGCCQKHPCPSNTPNASLCHMHYARNNTNPYLSIYLPTCIHILPQQYIRTCAPTYLRRSRVSPPRSSCHRAHRTPRTSLPATTATRGWTR